jgi:pyridoxal phosphate phosphatase PHOSPHO2
MLCGKQGLIIERIQASVAEDGKKKFIYLGDGSGDYCPSLKLRDGDYVMPRKNFPMWELICKHPLLIKAEIHEWIDGEDLEPILLGLVNKISIEEKSVFISAADCMLQNISVSAHEALPQALPVRL